MAATRLRALPVGLRSCMVQSHEVSAITQTSGSYSVPRESEMCGLPPVKPRALSQVTCRGENWWPLRSLSRPAAVLARGYSVYNLCVQLPWSGGGGGAAPVSFRN